MTLSSITTISVPILLLITTNILQIIAYDYRDHVSSGMNSNTELNIGDAIYSLNGNIRMKLGSKGQLNLQQYVSPDWQSLWANGVLAGTNAVLAIQYDGNLVVYSAAGGVAQWGAASNNPDPPQHLVVSNNGYAYMLNSKNEVMWSTGSTTNLPTFAPPTSAPVSVPLSCSGQFYPGPFAITDSTSVGTVTITDSTEISFMFKVNEPTWTCTTGWCHMLRIGPVGSGAQLPLIRISSLDQRLNVAYTGMQTYNNGVINMLDGNEHSFYFKHTPYFRTFIFDGTTLVNNTNTEPFVDQEIGNVYNIWVCDQVTSNVYATNGYIWDLCVHSTTTTTEPTTNIPTTSLPTTYIPTTSLPTTYIPTRATPTTVYPTTYIPTTSLPTTAQPTTNIPTTIIPTTSEPTTALPTTSMPTTSLPTTYTPTTNVPSTNIPTTQQPVTAIPTTNIPTVFPSDSPTDFPTVAPTKIDDGEQSVDDSKSTTVISFDNEESGVESESATLTQQVIVLIALCTIAIIILFCLICIVIVILKKMKNKKMVDINTNGNTNEKDVEMHRVLSFSQSPSTQGMQHITASTSMSGITPQMRTMSYKNNDINEGLNMDDITTNLPVLPKENDEINLDETEPDNVGNNYVTKGGPINNDNTPIGDDVNDESGESDHDGLYKKPVHAVQTPQYYNEDLFDDDDEDDFYKKPVNQNTGTLH